MEIRYTQGWSADDGQPCEMSAPDFDAFERQIRDNVTRIGVLSTDDKDALNVKKRRLPYVWHAFKPGTARRRCAVSAGDLYFLPLDLDGVTPAGWICIKGALGAYRGFAYTTASHLHPTANGEHRARIVLASTRPITALEKQRVLEQLQARIMDIVDIVYDGAVRWDSRVYNPAQMLFLPDERAEFTHFSGKAAEVDALLAAAPISTLVKPERGELDALEHLVSLDAIDGHTFEDLRSAMWHPTLLPLAESYPSWVDMGNRLAWFKETDYEDQALALWLDWSAAADNSDVDAAASKWNQLTADRTGYQAIFAMAQKNGWQNPGAERLRTTVASDSDFDNLSDTSDIVQGFMDINIDMTRHFLDRFIYVVDGDKVCDLSRPPYNCMMEMKAFKNLMAPHQFPPIGKGNPTPATKAWIEHPAKQVAESTGYQPGVGRIIKRHDGRYEINEFYMPDHPKTADTSKVEIFLKHLAYLVPDRWQQAFFIARLAWCVQRPERRCPISILHVAPTHGTGRGWVSQLMERVLGSWNCSRTRMKILCDNQFHDYLYHTLLCTIDEVRENDKRYEVNDKIRDVLTEPRFEVNRKYGKKMTIDIFTGFLLYTNHIDALVLPEEDRRIAVLGGPDAEAGEEHYAHIYSALGDSDFIAQVYWYLMSVDISQFNWQRAPNTKERQLMIESNKSDMEVALISVLENPPVPAMTYQQIVNEVIKEVGLDAEINQKHITRLLREKTKREPVRVKVGGIAQRFWLLEKNCDFSNDELREISETCENLQNQF